MSWRLDSQKTGLLVVDVQERLLPAVEDNRGVADRVARVVSIARLLGMPITVTEQRPEKLGPTVAPVRRALGEAYFPVTKSAFSACGCLPKDHRKTQLVVGLETHICVRQTVLDLRDTAVHCYVLSDACSSRYRADHNIALDELRHAGLSVTTMEAACWELLGGAGHPQFREALAILK